MRTSVHHDALKSLLDGSHPIHVSAAVLGGTVSTTMGVLTKYQAVLGSNPYYQNWFSSAQQHKKLRIHLPAEAPPSVQSADSKTDEYATASYFAGGKIITTNAVTPPLKTALESIGTELLYIENPKFNTTNGDNPFLTINLLLNGDVDFNILENFIIPENQITVYDKYINKESLDFLKFITRRLSAGSNLHIFHSTKTGGNLLDSTAISSTLAPINRKIKIICKTCPPSFTKKYHDRFIFFGNRFQIRFSVGLDCFGKINPVTGKRANRESELIFRDTSASGYLDIFATDKSVHRVKFHGL